jgi:uncharacterized protein (TIGR03435 family)
MRRVFPGFVVVALASQSPLALQAQSPRTPAANSAFEVASVKRNLSGRTEGSIRVPPAGAVSFTNVPLRVLIRDAYQVDPYTEQFRLISGRFVRIIGSSASGPQPDVPRFDVQAKPPDNSQPGERHAMMRALLEDRFKLRVHREMRQMRAYALTVARDGRLGPNLVPSKFDCETYLAQRRVGGAAQAPVDASGRSWCLAPIDHRRPGVEIMRMAGPVKLLMQRVQPYVDRPVVDATGLSGNVEWVLTFAWRPNAPALEPNAPADAPEIFTALQEQLGLKLQARQAPVEVLVVDSVELPTPD